MIQEGNEYLEQSRKQNYWGGIITNQAIINKLSELKKILNES